MEPATVNYSIIHELNFRRVDAEGGIPGTYLAKPGTTIVFDTQGNRWAVTGDERGAAAEYGFRLQAET